MNLELHAKRFCVFGLNDSGKSNFVKWLVRQWPGAAVYDVMHEYSQHTPENYVPTYKQASPQGIEELNMFCSTEVINNPTKPPAFILEEANRYCPPKPSRLPAGILRINDENAHYGMAFGVVCRRPTQLHQDLIELSHYRVFFRLNGSNDVRYLNELHAGLGDAVAQLQPYQFIVHDLNGFVVHAPVERVSFTKGT